MTQLEKVTVFYDGACPLCQREIGFYRRRRGANNIHWVDVSHTANETIAPGLNRFQALERFHVRRSDGKLVSGVTAFAELWLALPGFRRFGWFLTAPPIVWVLDHCYDVFLRIRPLLQMVVRQREQSGRLPPEKRF